MPRSRNRGKSAIIVMPTLSKVKVTIPAKKASDGSIMEKAHTYIRRIFGQRTVKRLRQNVIPEVSTHFHHHSKGPKRLNEGMHTRVQEERITPNRVRTSERLNRMQLRKKLIKPYVFVPEKRPMLYSKRTKLYQLKVA